MVELADETVAGEATADGDTAGPVVGLAWPPPSRATGVPARRAQPGWSGPSAAHPDTPPAKISSDSASASRIVELTRGQVASRQPEAASTLAMHAVVNPIDQAARASLPVPSEWISAIGQAPWAAQWMNRQLRKPIRFRARLVSTIAAMISMATAPRPSQNGR